MTGSKWVSALAATPWFSLAWLDILVRYRRSTFGPFWITLSTAAFAVAISTVYAGLFGQPVREYLHFVTIGLLSWQFLSACMIEGADSLVSGRDMLLNTRLDPVELPMRAVTRNAIILLHSAPVVVVTGIVAYPSASLDLPALLLGLGLLLANATWLAFFLGVAALRFRDVHPALSALLPFIFMVSPIVWRPEALPSGAASAAAAFVDWNPVYYLIEAVRSPLLDAGPNLAAFAFSAAFAAIGWTVTLWILRAYSARLRYWL